MHVKPNRVTRKEFDVNYPEKFTKCNVNEYKTQQSYP